VRADRIQLTDAGTRFRLTTPSGTVQVTLATPARVMVSNALAAAAAGEVLGLPLDVIRAGLEAFSPQAGRMGIRQLSGDIRLVDDTYNANPESMAAAIETLARMAGGRRTIAVLGDMLELGPTSERLHRDIGKTVGDAGIDRLYATGNFASALAEGARDVGMQSDRVFTGSKPDIIDHLVHHLAFGDLVLVKGSRGMAMEQVVAAISRWSEAQ
jgi:UDP-N-acetylmuramyl pentapeptide synthase